MTQQKPWIPWATIFCGIIALLILSSRRAPVPDFKPPEVAPVEKQEAEPVTEMTPKEAFEKRNGEERGKVLRKLEQAQKDGDAQWLKEWDKLIEEHVEETLTESPSDIMIMTDKNGAQAAIPRSAVDDWHEKMGPGWGSKEDTTLKDNTVKELRDIQR